MYILTTTVGGVILSTKDRVGELLLEETSLTSINLAPWYEWAFGEVLRRSYGLNVELVSYASYVNVYNQVESTIASGFMQCWDAQTQRLLIHNPHRLKVLLTNETVLIVSSPDHWYQKNRRGRKGFL